MSTNNNNFATALDALSIKIGKATAWLTLLMVVVTFVIVILRYLLDTGFIWLQELLIWMHACVFMLGAAYTLQQDEHVRVDIFYRQMSVNRRAWVNAIGVLLFVFPLCAFFLLESWDYVSVAWAIGEVSRDTGGLPYPAIPLLKSMLLLMPVVVGMQALAILLRSIQTLRSR